MPILIFLFKVFIGNQDWRERPRRNTWQRYCLHRIYGHPLETRFVRILPLEANDDCFALRFEIYGFRS